jgi:glycosyltransferase involved in cell wall biosynthesis
MLLAAHPHLAVPGAQMKLLNRDLKMLTISHGIEIWEPLPWFRRIAFRKSDLFLAPSRYTAERIAQEQNAPRNRIRRLPWPLSSEIIRMVERPDQLPLPPAFPRGLVVLTVARLATSEKYKGVDKLIQAVVRLRSDFTDLHLVVVGGGDDLARHVQLAADLQISDCVHFFDNLSRNEIAGCYSRCDIFALPSTGEGFGLVFLEAMAFGKPLIGAVGGGIPDVVEDGKNGYLVAAGDIGQLCQALTVLLSNEQLRVELGSKGAELVRAKYRFDGFCAELESILRDCGLESETR